MRTKPNAKSQTRSSAKQKALLLTTSLSDYNKVHTVKKALAYTLSLSLIIAPTNLFAVDLDGPKTPAVDTTYNAFSDPTSTITGGANLTITIDTGVGDQTLSGLISESAGTTNLTKIGVNTLTLSNPANSYTGVTTISAGTLSLTTVADGGTNSDIGAAPAVAANIVINNGTLKFVGVGGVTTQSTNHLFTVGTSGATIDASGQNALENLAFTGVGSIALSGTNTARTITFNAGGTATAANTFSPIIGDNGSGATSVTKTGAYTWTLSGVNTYTGATVVSAGTLIGSVSDTTALTVTGTYILGGAARTIGSLSGAGDVVLASAGGGGGAARALTVGDTTSTTFSGIATGAGSLVKVGTGTLTLTGATTTRAPRQFLRERCKLVLAVRLEP